MYVDEAGFHLLGQASRTWARRGQRPVLLRACTYRKFSAASAISEQGELVIEIQEQAYTGEMMAKFLGKLLNRFKQQLLVIWDGVRIHRSKEVKEFLRAHPGQIHLERQPAYSPELNAAEQVWNELKGRLKNVCCKTSQELEKKLRSAIRSLRRQREKSRSFFRHPEVGFYL